MVCDVVIVGGGPAGLTAALYAGRARLKTRVLEKLTIGGQLLLTETIENFPGIHQMNSRDWIEATKRQLADLEDVELTEGARVEKIEENKGIFKIYLVSSADNHKETIESKGVVIATGSQPKRLDIPGEDTFKGRGVSYCGICDGPLFRDKDVLLVGGGDTAIEEALFLRKFAKKVTVVHRRDTLRASPLLKERAEADEKIHFRWSAIPVEVVGKMRVEGLRIEDVTTGQREVLLASGIFVFIGSSPDTAFLEGFIDLDKDGYIITDEGMASSRNGVFASGDCRKRPLNQVVTACSEGAVAAYSLIKFLEESD